MNLVRSHILVCTGTGCSSSNSLSCRRTGELSYFTAVIILRIRLPAKIGKTRQRIAAPGRENRMNRTPAPPPATLPVCGISAVPAGNFQNPCCAAQGN